MRCSALRLRVLPLRLLATARHILVFIMRRRVMPWRLLHQRLQIQLLWRLLLVRLLRPLKLL